MRKNASSCLIFPYLLAGCESGKCSKMGSRVHSNRLCGLESQCSPAPQIHISRLGNIGMVSGESSSEDHYTKVMPHLICLSVRWSVAAGHAWTDAAVGKQSSLKGMQNTVSLPQRLAAFSAVLPHISPRTDREIKNKKIEKNILMPHRALHC